MSWERNWNDYLYNDIVHESRVLEEGIKDWVNRKWAEWSDSIKVWFARVFKEFTSTGKTAKLLYRWFKNPESLSENELHKLIRGLEDLIKRLGWIGPGAAPGGSVLLLIFNKVAETFGIDVDKLSTSTWKASDPEESPDSPKKLNEIWRSYAYSPTLNPDLWRGFEVKPKVSINLLEIAVKTIDDIVPDKINVVDVTIAGSQLSENWFKDSDIDLQIIVDYKPTKRSVEYQLMRERCEWNMSHRLKVNGYNVNVSIENAQAPYDYSRYSILKEEWVNKSNESFASHKAKLIAEEFKYAQYLYKREHYKRSNQLINSINNKIKRYKRAVLVENFSEIVEHNAAKILTESKTLQKLSKLQSRIHPSMLLEQDQEESTGMESQLSKFIERSNAIEGYAAPAGEVESALENFRQGAAIEETSDNPYIVSHLKAIEESKRVSTLNLPNIKLIHKAMGPEVLEDGSPGMFRTKEDPKYAATDKIKPALELWGRHKWSDPFEAHAIYELIHPFGDGNGRSGRIILAKMLNYNYAKVNALIGSDYFNKIQTIWKSDKYHDLRRKLGKND